MKNLMIVALLSTLMTACGMAGDAADQSSETNDVFGDVGSVYSTKITDIQQNHMFPVMTVEVKFMVACYEAFETIEQEMIAAADGTRQLLIDVKVKQVTAPVCLALPHVATHTFQVNTMHGPVTVLPKQDQPSQVLACSHDQRPADGVLRQVSLVKNGIATNKYTATHSITFPRFGTDGGTETIVISKDLVCDKLGDYDYRCVELLEDAKLPVAPAAYFNTKLDGQVVQVEAMAKDDDIDGTADWTYDFNLENRFTSCQLSSPWF